MLRRALRAVVVVAVGVALCLGALVVPACGPIEYIVNMPLDATRAIAQAKTVKGEKFAPYETTAALEYQHKSRELAGYARFHSSVIFARKSADNARKAKKLALDRASMPVEQQQDLGVIVSGGGTVERTDSPGPGPGDHAATEAPQQVQPAQPVTSVQQVQPAAATPAHTVEIRAVTPDATVRPAETPAP